MKPSKLNPISAFFALSSSWIKILHPPLPLTARDERRLLIVLKESFRKQLAASTYPPAPNPESLLSSGDDIVKFKSPAEEHFQRLLKGPVFGAQGDGNKNPDVQGQLQRYMDEPLEVFDERCFHGVPSAAFATSVLKRHTENMLKIPEAQRDPDWVEKSINRVLSIYQRAHPRIHFNNGAFRRQIIRMLIHGKKAHIAAGLITKDWLLKAEVGDPGSERIFELRHQLVNDLIDIMEEIKGRDAAAQFLLKMIAQWDKKGGYMHQPQESPMEPTRVKQISALSKIKKPRVPLNPFQTKAQHFLLHYAQFSDSQLSPVTAQARKQIYETCFPLVRNKMVRSRLILHFTGNPYPLYRLLMKSPDALFHKEGNKALLQYVQACLEATLALVLKGESAKANEIIKHVHEKLQGRVTGLDADMFDEIQRWMDSPRLSEVLSSYTRQVLELLEGFSRASLSSFWQDGMKLEPEGSPTSL